jgi:hypothetical protein
MIWFYPLNELEISGYETFVVTILSPILTCVGSIMEFCQSLHGIAVLRSLSMIGIASFQAPTTLMRLVLLSFGCGSAMLWFCGVMWNKSSSERYLGTKIMNQCTYNVLYEYPLSRNHENIKHVPLPSPSPINIYSILA